MPADPNDCTDERNECMWVTFMYDNPGHYSCYEVNVENSCLAEGSCRPTEGLDCPDLDGEVDPDAPTEETGSDEAAETGEWDETLSNQEMIGAWTPL